TTESQRAQRISQRENRNHSFLVSVNGSVLSVTLWLASACVAFAAVAERCPGGHEGILGQLGQRRAAVDHFAGAVGQVDELWKAALHLEHAVRQRDVRRQVDLVLVSVEQLGWGQRRGPIHSHQNLRRYLVTKAANPLLRRQRHT